MGWLGTWKKRRKLTISNTNVDSDLSNFPVLVNLSTSSGTGSADVSSVFDELPDDEDAETKLLLHMNDVGLDDSTVYTHTTTLVGSTARNATQSKFGGYSAYFSSLLSDYISCPDSDDWDLGSEDFTIDFWIRSDGTFGDNGIFGCSNGGGAQPKMACYLDSISAGYLSIHKNGSSAWSVSWAWSPSDDTWYHVAIVRSGSSWYLFIDGTQVGGTQTQAGAFEATTSDFRIGADGEGWKGFKGWIDEFRFTKGKARWTSNFTVPTSPYVFGNRKKIAVTTSDGETQCYVEIERWDDTNEKASLWVKVPTVTSASETILYLYYDTDQSDNDTYVGDVGSTPGQNVWDSNFKAVWHMGEDPSGGTGAIKDSTSNGNDGTSSGSMTYSDLVDGKIGKAIDFDGSDDYINCGSDASLDDIAIKTIEVTVKFDDLGVGLSGRIIQKANINADGWQLLYQGGGASYDRVYFGQDWNGGTFASWVTPTESIAVSTWYNVAVTYDKGDVANDPLMYIDGVSKTVSELAAPTGTADSDAANSLWIGARQNSGSDKNFDGIIDEIRISAIARSADWIKATHYSNTDDLIAFGGETRGVILDNALTAVVSLVATINAPTVVNLAGTPLEATAELSATPQFDLVLQDALGATVSLEGVPAFTIDASAGLKAVVSMSIGGTAVMWMDLIEFYSIITKVLGKDSEITKVLSKNSLITKIVTGDSDLGV